MKLSNDLISQFVKITNDNSDKKKDEIVYGTAVEYSGTMYIKLDGSDLLTPVDTTSTLHNNDRVTVDLSNHNATVTGNISNPSVSGVEINRVENDLRVEFEEGLDNLLLIFKDGYDEGITSVNKDGVKVTHTKYGGYTKMSYDGFYLNDGKKDVLKCTKDGLVYSGTITASDINSTDGTFRIDKNGNITGATLRSSKGGNFSIDENGEITAAGLAVEDNISSNTVICKEILNKAYPKTLTGTVNLQVNSNSGNDDNICENGVVFKTLQGAIDSIPKFMNGKTVNIYMKTASTENVNITYFCGGRIYIFMEGHSLFGTLHCYHVTSSLYVYGGYSTASESYGVIHPSKGLDAAGRSTSISINQCKNVTLYYINLYSPDKQADGLTGLKQGLGCQGGGYTYCSNIHIINCGVGFRCNSGCQLHMNASTGIATNYGFQAATGGTISFANNKQSGGSVSPTNKTSGGQIWTDNCTFASGESSSSSNTAPTTTTTKTVSYTASSAQALQFVGTSSAMWRTDCKPKVGDWGYGDHTGWWFFGDDFENMSNKDISKIEITFTREKGGNYAAVSHNFYVHNYETQPSTKSPSYNTAKIATASVKTQATHTITITDSNIINKIKAAKGICSVPASQTSSYYSVMSANMKVKFTYKG